jgi:hypothetical protein
MSVFARTPAGNSICRIGKGATYLSKNWYLKLHLGGKTTYWPLFEGKGESAKRADHIKAFLKLPGNRSLAKVRAEFYGVQQIPLPTPASTGPVYATIGECLDTLTARRIGLNLEPETLRGYIGALPWVVRVARSFASGRPLGTYTSGVKQAVRALRTDILTAQLAHDFKEGYVARAAGDKQAAKRSANSNLAKARAVFSEAAVEQYRLAGLTLPDLTGFLKVKKYTHVRKGWRPPPDTVIAQLINWADQGNDPEREKVLVMALWFGLRREECAEARWHWLSSQDTLTVDHL